MSEIKIVENNPQDDMAWVLENQASKEALSGMVKQLFGEYTLFAIEEHDGVLVCTIYTDGQEKQLLGISIQRMYGFYLQQLDNIDKMSDEEILELKRKEYENESRIVSPSGHVFGSQQIVAKKILLN